MHLIVRRDNVHARSLYGRIGCKEAPWVLYEPLSEEVYMVAQVSEMDRLIARVWSTPTVWEVEVGECTARLRNEDRTWAQQMYREEHGGRRKWERHHAHQAAHILVWDGSGVGAATGMTRREQHGVASACNARMPRRVAGCTVTQIGTKKMAKGSGVDGLGNAG